MTLIAERNTARWIELNQQYWKELSTAPDSARRASLATLEFELVRAAAAGGTAFDDAECSCRAAIIARRRQVLRELETLEVPAPGRVFDARLDLDFEGVKIEIRDHGPATSPNDPTIWPPHQRTRNRSSARNGRGAEARSGNERPRLRAGPGRVESG